MPSSVDHFADSLESSDIRLFGRHQRVLPKVWDHLPHELRDIPHFKLKSLIRSVGTDRTAFPHFLNLAQHLCAICVLADRETRSNLPPESMSPTRMERDTEARFTICESGYVGR